MELIPINDIPDDYEIWKGTVFRVINIGMNVPKEKDFYDYMLVNIPWEADFLILVNVTHDNIKAGAVYGTAVKVLSPGVAATVSGKAIKEALSLETCFLVKGW